MCCFDSFIRKKPGHFCYELVDVLFVCITDALQNQHEQANFSHKKRAQNALFRYAICKQNIF